MQDDLKPLPRFTPSTAGLDRDAILFEAGRASSRGGKSWKVAASMLAATQAVTLAIFFHPQETDDRLAGHAAVAVRDTEPAPAGTPDPSSFMALHRRVTEEFRTTGFEIAPTAAKPVMPLSGRDSIIQ